VYGLGCGGDDDGGGGVSSGLPPNTKLSELSAEQVMDSCLDLVAGLDATLTDELDRFDCTLRALPMSISVTLAGDAMGDPAKCRDLRDRCLSGENIGGGAPVQIDPVGSQIQCGAPAAVSAAQSCDANVGAYESCLNAIVANAQAAFRTVDCSLATDPEQLQDLMRPPPAPQPQACRDLDAQCPQLGIGAIGAAVSP
jgi:hypothetical protein